MNMKLVQGIAIGLLSVTALTFLLFGYLEVAVLFMTLLFVLTNSFRYRHMKAQGMHREAKWMLGMSVVFGLLFFVVLGTILL
ncbi:MULTISPECIES: hypothetical protein [Planococcus]|uniref:Uncharacterized protein n=2 Tax=Planococcus TaxID=1372 RepID=A0ABM5WZG1_9BACL|nr:MULTISPECIES: hypothetical protein [Planococcus]ALS79757.1 hypothetical protein AUO94_14545 [Planococcus kocurii]AQU78257.1 hypothetical protein AJGP001_02555 [Planococcus faecalis]KAA0957164.1 hypothetical protein FQ085_08625 [Planococcus sp. ANT_H30]MDJ0332825.1 hypothetical protein [Planococcus sp. S3-L1]